MKIKLFFSGHLPTTSYFFPGNLMLPRNFTTGTRFRSPRTISQQTFKICNMQLQCSATPQSEVALATMAKRGQSQVHDLGTDSRSAKFPRPQHPPQHPPL